MSKSKGCFTGCLSGCFIVLVLFAIGLGVGAYFVNNHINTVLERFERTGYKVVKGKIIEVDERLQEPTIFLAKRVVINKGSERGVAFLCNEAEIRGHVVGNVHFKGKTLTIHDWAVLDLDLDILAAELNLYGMVKGEITGYYHSLHRKKDPQVSP